MSENPDGIVDIHGKQYRTVAYRVRRFREGDQWDGWSVETSVLERSKDSVLIQAVVKDTEGRVRSTGHGEESRHLGNINKTSALENAETSAVGRCLGLLDPELMGSHVASAEEVERAEAEQDQIGLIGMIEVVRDNWESISSVKAYLLSDDYGLAKEAWHEIPQEEQAIIWRAPSKGGVLTTREREQMKSDPWSAA